MKTQTDTETTHAHVSMPSTKSTANAQEPAMKTSHAATKETTHATVAAPAMPKPSTIFIPTADAVSALVTQLDAVAAVLGDSATPLTTAERKHAVRAKKGADATIGLMAGLGQQYNVQLPGIDPALLPQYSTLVARL